MKVVVEGIVVPDLDVKTLRSQLAELPFELELLVPSRIECLHDGLARVRQFAERQLDIRVGRAVLVLGSEAFSTYEPHTYCSLTRAFSILSPSTLDVDLARQFLAVIKEYHLLKPWDSPKRPKIDERIPHAIALRVQLREKTLGSLTKGSKEIFHAMPCWSTDVGAFR